MIYLIGGAPKCGKTTLAKKLANEIDIPWLSTDTLQNVIKPYLSKEELVKAFPSSNQNCENNDEKYLKYSVDEIVTAYQKQAKTSYAAIDMFTICEITNEHDYTIEGYQITPELAKILIDKYGQDKVKAVFLTKSDKQQLVENFEKSNTNNDWILRRTKDRKTIFPKIAEMISEYSKYFEVEANKYDFRIYNMDKHFNSKQEEIFRYLKN